MDWIFTSDTLVIILVAIGNLIFNRMNHSAIKNIDTKMDKEIIAFQHKIKVKTFISEQKYSLEIAIYEKLAELFQDTFNDLGYVVSRYSKSIRVDLPYTLLDDSTVSFKDFYYSHCNRKTNDLITFYGKMRFKTSKKIDDAIARCIDSNKVLMENIFKDYENDFKLSKTLKTEIIKNYEDINSNIDIAIELLREYYINLDIIN